MIENLRESTLSWHSVIVGAIIGLLHTIVAVLLWNTFGFENLLAAFATEPLYSTYVVIGMFVLGFIPGVLYADRKSVSPICLVVALLVLSGFGTWQTVQSGATPVSPTPFGWYTLLWVGIIAVAVLVGGLELRIRQQITA